MSGVTVEHRGIAVADLARMIENDHLRGEVLGTTGWLILGVTSNVATAQLLHRDVLNVEADVVAGHGLGQSLVVHLYGLDLSGESCRGECHHHARFHDAGLDATHRYRAYAADLIYVLDARS